MKCKWAWRCPICKAMSKETFLTSGKARRNGRTHMKLMHKDFETEPELIKVW